ncbi:hypothetical protein B2J88_15080 [Rhodococcus sp. SRB_17]|nr:hypothetical protein [Rhodococcus sp. SRB_17]
MRQKSITAVFAEFRYRIEVWITATSERRLALRVSLDVARADVVDSAMTLSAQSFTSLLPVIIAAATLEQLEPLASKIRGEFGIALSGLGTESSASAAFGVVGVLMLVISATSYARALGRMYGRLWMVQAVTVRQAWRWMAVVVLIAVAVASSMWCSALSGIRPLGPILEPIVVFAVWVLAWSGVPRLLTGRQLSPRMIWCSGILTGAGLTVLHVVSALFLPRMARTSEEQFGVLGVMFTLVGWLFVYSAIVVVAACICSSFSREPSRAGAWLRSGCSAESPVAIPAAG